MSVRIHSQLDLIAVGVRNSCRLISVGGFDIATGNPPLIQPQRLDGRFILITRMVMDRKVCETRCCPAYRSAAAETANRGLDSTTP